MTVNDLKKVLDKFKDDYEVVIPLDNPAVGPRRFASIEAVYPGIDWDMHKVFLTTKNKLVEVI